MAQILVYFFRWYLRRDRKLGSGDAAVVDEEQPASMQREDQESDITAHDNDDDDEEVDRVPVERVEEKETVKSG